MYQNDRDLAVKAAQRAGEIALSYWQQGIQAESKPDLSPVTVADRESERAIAAMIEAAFPEDGILGEEGANKASRNGRQWIIDPIDGTRDFVRGNRAWAVLIGLEEHGEIVAGVAFLPAMQEMFTATRGGGAFLNGAPIRVSSISDPSQAVLCLNGFNSVAERPFARELLEKMRPYWAVRSMGGCLDAVMVARGQAEVWIELSGKPWDFAPLKLLAEEAGGRFFNFEGGSSIYGGNCVICTPSLEAAARSLVGRGIALETEPRP
ncbi:MAG: inositol monophosphatase family protein [Bryobacteraceae bacterium]